MATIYKVLGQSAPGDTNNTNLYTVPTGTQAVVSTIAIANTSSSASTCRIYIRISGAAAAVTNALVYDAYVNAYDTTPLTLGITIGAGDIITVRSGTGSALTFHAFGSEIS